MTYATSTQTTDATEVAEIDPAAAGDLATEAFDTDSANGIYRAEGPAAP